MVGQKQGRGNGAGLGKLVEGDIRQIGQQESMIRTMGAYQKVHGLQISYKIGFTEVGARSVDEP